MISPIIHYFWLGKKKLPKMTIKCIDSWKRFCPDFEIKQWNESNYDFTKQSYMKQAFEAKKWGFVPDYARIDVIYQYGGIYLDTDVEILKPLTALQNNHFFASTTYPGEINLGQGFGAEANHPLLQELMEDYNHYSFRDEYGKINLTPSPTIQTKYLTTHYNMVSQKGYNAIQKLKNDVTIYPYEYFDPLYFDESNLRATIHLTTNTYSIHHYMNSWVPLHKKLLCRIKSTLSLLLCEQSN